MRRWKLLAAAAALPLSACSSIGAGEAFSQYYRLIPVRPVSVGNGSMVVTPPRPWNEQRRWIFTGDVRWVEDWTLNGPLLDGISFVTGLPSGRYLVYQRRSEERQVPKFRSDMLAPEIASMIESAFRVRAGSVEFNTLGLAPRTFLGHPGFQFDFEHLDQDEVWRKGRVVGAVIDGRLYMIMIDAARSHYFANALPDFETLVTTARRK